MGSVEFDTKMYLHQQAERATAEEWAQKDIEARQHEIAAEAMESADLIRDPLLSLLDSDKDFSKITVPLIVVLRIFKDASANASDIYKAIYNRAFDDAEDAARDDVLQEEG